MFEINSLLFVRFYFNFLRTLNIIVIIFFATINDETKKEKQKR
jgi:hypothetical protein